MKLDETVTSKSDADSSESGGYSATQLLWDQTIVDSIKMGDFMEISCRYHGDILNKYIWVGQRFWGDSPKVAVIDGEAYDY